MFRKVSLVAETVWEGAGHFGVWEERGNARWWAAPGGRRHMPLGGGPEEEGLRQRMREAARRGERLYLAQCTVRDAHIITRKECLVEAWGGWWSGLKTKIWCDFQATEAW